jgi:hypothetical protein
MITNSLVQIAKAPMASAKMAMGMSDTPDPKKQAPSVQAMGIGIKPTAVFSVHSRIA